MSALSALTPAVADAVVLIWDYMQVGHALEKADVIIALGSNDVRVAERAAELYLRGFAPLLLFSGGVGALTRGLYGTSEAAYFARIAEARGVPASRILIEADSTNTGENIRFSRALLAKQQCAPSSIILVQKPFMERRTLATFLKQWPDAPAFAVTSPQIPLAEYPREDVERLRLADVIDTLCGDLQRIAVYPAKGFQVRMAIPQSVWDALHLIIREGFGGPQLLRVAGAAEGSRDPVDYEGLGGPPPDA